MTLLLELKSSTLDAQDLCQTRDPKASPERARSESSLLARQATIGPDHLHAVSGLDHVHQVVVEDDVHRAGQLAGRGLLRHLLHGDGLVVLIDRKTKLCLQRVVLFVLLPRHGDN